MKAEDLNIIGDALEVARDLQTSFPSVIFTSGRRSLEDQARAMAQNVVANRKWITQTYVASVAARALQNWVDAQRFISAASCEAGFISVLSQLCDADLDELTVWANKLVDGILRRE